jgi:hypothetical protein
MFEGCRTIKQERRCRRMKKDCCNIKVTETDKGFQIMIEGEDVKEKCKTMFDNCCSNEKMKSCFESCCGPAK